MSDDFDAFKSDDTGDPPDGEHTAWLERTSVFQSRAGAWWIRTCWRTTDRAFYWEVLNGVEGNRKPFTKELLAGIGVDLVALRSWDELGDELAQFEDRTYTVGVAHKGEFLNTTVVGVAGDAPPPDVPVDTQGLPEPEPAAAAAGSRAADLFGDDVPF
jgi:hypothetical protein